MDSQEERAYRRAREEYLRDRAAQARPRVPWDQVELEPARAYEYFCAYRNMGPRRSLEALSRKFKVGTTQIEEYSSRWRWVDRAKAWDAMVARRKTIAREGMLDYLAQLDLVGLTQGMELAVRSITRYNKQHKNDKGENPDLKTVVFLLTEFNKQSRALRGEASSREVLELGGARERLEELLGKYEKRSKGGEDEPPEDTGQ